MVGLDLPFDASHERRPIADRRRGGRIEIGQQAHYRAQRFRVDRSTRELRIEQACAIETPHADQPVHDLTRAIDRKLAIRGLRQGREGEIDVGCEPSVEAEVGEGVEAACLERAIVHRVADDRLAKFPGAVADQEYPGEVSLDRLVVTPAKAAQERDFCLQARGIGQHRG